MILNKVNKTAKTTQAIKVSDKLPPTNNQMFSIYIRLNRLGYKVDTSKVKINRLEASQIINGLKTHTDISNGLVKKLGIKVS